MTGAADVHMMTGEALADLLALAHERGRREVLDAMREAWNADLLADETRQRRARLTCCRLAVAIIVALLA
jgi:hypothetical protein